MPIKCYCLILLNCGLFSFLNIKSVKILNEIIFVDGNVLCKRIHSNLKILKNNLQLECILHYLFLLNVNIGISLLFVNMYSETCLNRTLSKPKTCLNQTDFTVPSTKCLYNFNLCKPNTCLNWTNYSVIKGFSLGRFYCIWI